jgi:hypothetical protein
VSGALGPGAFLAGGLVLSITLGCAIAAATVIVRRRLDHLMGAVRVVALGLITLGALLLSELIPLILGVMSRVTVPVCAALILLGTTRVPGGSSTRRDVIPARAETGLLAAAAPGLLVAGACLAYLSLAATFHVVSVDALSFHFPGIIRFVQTGSLWKTTQFLPGQAQGNYPQYGDLLLLALVLPWHSLAFVRYADPPLLALAALAVYGTARELRAPVIASALSALAVTTIGPALAPALSDVLADPTFLAGFSAGALFLVRHWRTGARGDLVLAGVGLGLALGTKWYGLPDVPLLIAAWVAVALVVRRHPRRIGSDAALLVGVIALSGGIWLLRNLILTGNPVFDYRVHPFGVTIFPAPPNPFRSQLGFTLAHYFGDWGVLHHYVWPVFRHDFGLSGLLIVAGALGAVAVALVARRREEPLVAVLFIGAVLAALAYAITPYSAQGFAGRPVLVSANTRYGIPALLLAAPLVAYAVRGRRWLEAPVDVALAVAIVLSLHRYVPASAGRVILAAVILVLAAGALLALRHSRPLLTGAAVAAACAVAALAYHYQRVLASRPYLPGDPTVDYVLARAPRGTHIGVTGTWTAQGLVPVAPLFGPRLSNPLGYVGPFRAHRLEQYASAGPFIAALRRGGYELLEIGTGFPPSVDPPQAAWARRAGYREITRSLRLILMRSPGAL